MCSIFQIGLILSVTVIGCGDWTGTYYRGSSWEAEEFTMNADSTFRFRDFDDVGGWRQPMMGLWYRTEDTIFLFSQPMPAVEHSREEWKSRSGSVVILRGKGQDWFDVAPHLRVFHSNRDMSPQFSDSLGIFWSAPDISLSQGDTIVVNISNASVQYLVKSDGCNTITLFLNMNDTDCGFFFWNHRLLLMDGKLIGEFKGKFDFEHPFTRVKNSD